MKRFRWLLLVGLLQLSVNGAETKELKDQALIILSCNNLADMEKVVEQIENQGGKIAHLFPPHALIGHIPRFLVSYLNSLPEVDSVNYGMVEPASISQKYGVIAGFVAEAWNRNYAGPPKARPLREGKDKPRPLINDALIPPRITPKPMPPGIAAEKPVGAGDQDTSDFMVGRIAVAVILPESNGQQENWDKQRETTVVRQIQAGMNWWAEKAPEAQLQFWYKYFLPSNAPATVSTGYEPINRPQSDENLWINEIMIKITGHKSGTHFDKVRYYNNQIREEFHTDWAFTIFVVDSLTDTDGEFADDYFAYAWVGGPFLVMTYDNDNWGIDDMDKICAHEMGHIFYALDEYKDSKVGCSPRSGYLNVENGNYAGCGDEPCIMRSEGGADAGHACDFTRGQVGVWTKSDGALTVLGTASIDLQLYGGTNSLQYRGNATIKPQPGINPGTEWTPPATCIKGYVANVQYEVQRGTWSSGWQDAAPGDGSFNSQNEPFGFTTAPLADGFYTVQVRAINSIGRVMHIPYATMDVAVPTTKTNIVTIGTKGDIIATDTIKLDYPDMAVAATTTLNISFSLYLPPDRPFLYEPTLKLPNILFNLNLVVPENEFKKEVSLTFFYGNPGGKEFKLFWWDKDDNRWVGQASSKGTFTTVNIKRLGTFVVAEYTPPTEFLANVSSYPNPFIPGREAAIIHYVLKQDTPVSIRIYDAIGGLVKKFDSPPSGAGLHDEIKWDGRNGEGSRVGQGIYFCVIEAGGQKEVWKIGVK